MLGTTFGGNHLACAAALAVLEVMGSENLMANAKEVGDHLVNELMKMPGLQNIRGKGLMIGFDVPEHLKDLKKNLLWKHRIFTGEAKPNVIRLLPSLALSRADADKFLDAARNEIASLQNTMNGNTSINKNSPPVGGVYGI
jgi:acetylornithine aminotransferase